MSSAERTVEEHRIRNRVVERIAAGETAFGIGVRAVRSGEIAVLAKATGHDFLYIDTQHAMFDPREIAQIAQVALGVGVAPFVRVRSADDPDVSLHLDAGALGIVVPDVVSADQARRVVDATKYTPVGRRSLAGMSVHYDYLPAPFEQQMRAEDDAVMLFCMIESRDGLAALDEIAAVPGLDGLYLGLGDYLADIGAPGAFDSPEALSALERVVEACERNGLVAGSGGAPALPVQLRAIRSGVRFLMTSSDLGLIRSGATRARDAIVSGLGEPAADEEGKR